MAQNLYTMQALKESNIEKGIVEMFIRESDLLKILPIENVPSLQVTTRRMSSLPSVAWRARGQRHADGGQPGFELVTDSVYNVGSEVNIDEADMRDKGPYFVGNPIKWNYEQRAKAIAYELQDKILNGDQATDANTFDGIKVRISNLASAQTLYGSSKIDVRPSTMDTVAEAMVWINRIEEAKYQCDGHTADICLTDSDIIRYLKNALRVAGQQVELVTSPSSNINERKTQNDVPARAGRAFVWDGTTYIDMGVKADQTTKICATETVDSGTCRPMYFVKTGGDYFSLIQNGGLDTTEPVLTDDLVTHRGKISWYVGARHVHNRFAVKLTGNQVS